MNIRKMKKNKGFTLIEILIVIGIIAILATIVIIAINPAKQFAQARNTQRTAGVTAILNAVGQRIADNKGVFEGDYNYNTATPPVPTEFCDAIPNSTTPIGTGNGTSGLNDPAGGSGNLGCLTPTYIPTLPTEPLGAGETQYTIVQDTLGRITVCAPEATQEAAIPDAATNPICITR